MSRSNVAHSHHIAEINIARVVAPLDDPRMADFIAQLDLVNAAAEASPGFLWRLKSEEGGASSYVQAFDDPAILINMSVWKSLEELKAYVYRSHEHLAVLRDRRRWALPPGGPSLAIWWVPAGVVPTVAEARERLELLSKLGPTPEAFTFKTEFPSPGQDSARSADVAIRQRT